MTYNWNSSVKISWHNVLFEIVQFYHLLYFKLVHILTVNNLFFCLSLTKLLNNGVIITHLTDAPHRFASRAPDDWFSRFKCMLSINKGGEPFEWSFPFSSFWTCPPFLFSSSSCVLSLLSSLSDSWFLLLSPLLSSCFFYVLQATKNG